MSKTKSAGKFHYELLYIIPNKFTQEEAGKINEKVQEGINNHEGEITYSKEWGNKKLAYPIKHFTHGYYYLLEFDMPGQNVNQMNYWLKMYGDILRHQIVKAKKRSPEEVEEEEQKMTDLQEEEQQEEEAPQSEEVEQESEQEESAPPPQESQEVNQEEESQDDTSTAENKEDPPAKEEEVSGRGSEKKKEDQDKKKNRGKDDKADLDDLDKKLDDILDSHDLL